MPEETRVKKRYGMMASSVQGFTSGSLQYVDPNAQMFKSSFLDSETGATYTMNHGSPVPFFGSLAKQIAGETEDRPRLSDFLVDQDSVPPLFMGPREPRIDEGLQHYLGLVPVDIELFHDVTGHSIFLPTHVYLVSTGSTVS